MADGVCTLRWKLSPFDMCERVVEDVVRHGSVVMHVESGRMYQHKHGFNVPLAGHRQLSIDYPSPVNRARVFTANENGHSRVASKPTPDARYRSMMDLFLDYNLAGVSHCGAWIDCVDGKTVIIIAAIAHVPSMKQAVENTADGTVHSSRTKKMYVQGTPERKTTRSVFNVARRGRRDLP